MKKLTPRGRTALAVAVGVLVAIVGTKILEPSPVLRKTDKILKWEALEGKDGTDLQRLSLPKGWIVEGADGYLIVIDDPEHEWLAESE